MVYEFLIVNFIEFVRKGVICVLIDSSGWFLYIIEIWLCFKSGEYWWYFVCCVEIDNVDFGNGVSFFFGLVMDINDLKLFEMKLKEVMDLKSCFFSNMFYEIRMFFIGIFGMVSFL